MSGNAFKLLMKSPPGAVPGNTVLPAITGTATVGNVLTVSNGTWSRTPTSYAYQWTRDGSNISAANASTYTLVTADGGTTVACIVTATNIYGSATATATGVSVSAASSYDDGSSVAKTATVQHPHLLDLSSGTNENGKTFNVRPSWNVAGVDYAVGPASAQTYKTPGVDAMPSGATYGGGVVEITGACTLDGWNFDIGSAVVVRLAAGIGANNVTITNCKFKGYTASSPLIFHYFNSDFSGLLTVAWCRFDCDWKADDVIKVGINGSSFRAQSDIHHNHFFNVVSDAIKVAGPFSKLHISYNLFESLASDGTQHSDVVQFYIPSRGTATSLDDLVFRGNTIYQPAATSGVPAYCSTATIFYSGCDTGLTLNAFEIDHNVVVGIGNTGHAGAGGNIYSGFGTFLQGFGNANNSNTANGSCHDNYSWMEGGGSYNGTDYHGYVNKFLVDVTRPYATSFTITGNVDMRDGSSMPTQSF